MSIYSKLIKSKMSLRENPLCPFGDFAWNKYFWTVPKEDVKYESNYWGLRSDPDGNYRNLIEEWDQQVKNQKHIIDFLKEVNPGKILDVGCSPGFILSALAKNWDKYGIDISHTALEHCTKYAEVVYGELPEVKFEDQMPGDQVPEHHGLCSLGP